MSQTIIKSFDSWTSAQAIKSNGRVASVDNQKPYGIDKLRELILDLAVRGKLVPQDINDGTANELIKKILKEKECLVNEGKIKFQKPIQGIANADKPYIIPKNWSWDFLGNFVYLEMGQSPLSNSYNQERMGVPFFQGKTDFGVLHPTPRYWCTQPSKFSYPEDILLSVRAPVGPTNITDIECCIGRGLAALRPLLKTNTKYLLYYMRATQAKLESMATGTTFPAISKGDIETFLIAVPPLSEQHRIVAKVDELMVLCDLLEQQQTSSNSAHQQLVEVLLGTLTSAKSQTEFNEAWERIVNHFDTLFTTEFAVEQLKQTILQLAVMGKLVPQNPTDEPASELLKKIAKVKERLVKEGKISKQKFLLEILDEGEIQLPQGWESICLGNYIYLEMGQSPSSNSYNQNESGIPFFQGKTDFGLLYPTPRYWCTEPLKYSYPGDVLLSVRAPVGPTNITAIECCIGRGLAALRPLAGTNTKFLLYYLRSLQKKLQNLATGTTFSAISKTDIETLLIIVPPIAEQHRIVSKVDELFALCDALKARIKDAQATQVQLADAVVEGVLG